MPPASSSPRISVLLPIYNGGKFLNEALQSLADQTFTDFEVIAVDDHSTDDSALIVTAWTKKDPRFHLIANTGTNGLPNALNFGLQFTTGEYIARMDQDDICRPERFAEEAAFLDRHPDIGLVGSAYQPFGVNGKPSPVHHPRRSVDIAWQFLTNTRFAHPTTMFRKSVIETVGQYPIQEAEDFGFFSAIVHSSKTANVASILLDYREHGGNMSTIRREIIQQAVRETFLRNFVFYIGSTDGAPDFYRFHAGRWLPLSAVPSVYRSSIRILGSIRRSYGLGVFNLEVILTVLRVHTDLFRAILRSLLRLQPLVNDPSL